VKPTPDQIAETIVTTIGNVTRDWSLSADVGPGTRLIGELGFTSMDVIDLFAMLDIAFRVKLPFEQFVIGGESGEYRQEMTVAELAAFVDEHYDKPRSGVHAV
jgi:acyl carrier protein